MSFSAPIVDRGQVEHAILDHLDTWIIPYLAVTERQKGLSPRTLATPKSWEMRTDFELKPEDTLPAIVVVSTGTSAGRPPRQSGDGLVTAWWLVAVGAVVAASNGQAAKDLSGYYGAAIRGAMTLESPTWEQVVGISWDVESYDDMPSISERTMAAVRLGFTVEVQSMMSVFDGFGEVPDDPYAAVEEVPIVPDKEHIQIEVSQEAIDG